jgi:hypothetical protein
MDDKTYITVFVLMFIVGAILGGLLILVVMILMAWYNIEIPTIISGLIILLVAISATIWGDRFLMGFMKIFKIFRYFP